MKLTNIILAAALSMPIEAASNNEKCHICHKQKDDDEGWGKWNTLKVSCNAVPAHLGHGDLNGSCESQLCQDLCHHQSCMDDYSENIESNDCICDNPGTPTVCGTGASCDPALDECACDDPDHVFDENHNCVPPCAGNGINIHMRFRSAQTSDFFYADENDTEAKLDSLRSNYSALFAMEDQDCWLNMTGLEELATPDPSSDKLEFLPNQAIGYNTDRMTHDECDLSRYTKIYSTPDGFHPTLVTDCEGANEFFQSLVSKRDVSATNFEGGSIVGSSDFHRLELHLSNVWFNDTCPTQNKVYNQTEGFYHMLKFEWSISASATVVVGGGRGLRGRRGLQEFEPVWLANVNIIRVKHIPYNEFELDGSSSHGILFPFIADHHLVHNADKNWHGEVRNYPDDSYINNVPWVAKMYGHSMLPSLKSYSSTYKYAAFKLYADVDEILIEACA